MEKTDSVFPLDAWKEMNPVPLDEKGRKMKPTLDMTKKDIDDTVNHFITNAFKIRD